MNPQPGTERTELIDQLELLAAEVGRVMHELKCDPALVACSNEDLVRVLTTSGQILRHTEGALIAAVDQVAVRSSSPEVSERMTIQHGCHDVSELTQRATLAAPATVARWRRAGKAIHRETSMVSGELLPAVLPQLREAMITGHVGVDGLLAAAKPLADLARRVDHGPLLQADAALAAAARGEGAEGPVSACADLLGIHATVWASVLDPDGTEPKDTKAAQRRGITLGAEVDGIVPVRGGLLSEVAAMLVRVTDATGSPRTQHDTGGVRFVPSDADPGDDPYEDAVGPLDDRTTAQKRHDAFATALMAAAASGSLPTIGGAAPTLIVHVREEDLVEGHGTAHSDAGAPLPMRAAHAVGCAGIVQRVLLGPEGRILRIGTAERVFNKHQRRAIALRDGGCVIPGCGVPPAWCEIHHVHEHAQGGATHTDNGVLICWFHHRYHQQAGWAIRMNRGIPEIRAPRWYDPDQRWRTVTTSPTRLRDTLGAAPP
ncbi:HNH endonuclease signature motif containing protein [Microbacterium sp. C7(2022)]|uniref:HNH endonuclease signature motif containing protein n=1 Tax=Microbacterium sp. C7(2022) TaxID=2992759 RepID=UPI00237A94C3|nr:HNH endonuclease signature motif containing protein [Microbacterium sp. C7(2022)]MDE0546562.1 HNH endonuclease [Microbacterium sp. C7(2022)]